MKSLLEEAKDAIASALGEYQLFETQLRQEISSALGRMDAADGDSTDYHNFKGQYNGLLRALTIFRSPQPT